jgi:hypothetical protein
MFWNQLKDRIGGGRNAAHLVNKDDPNVLENLGYRIHARP